MLGKSFRHAIRSFSSRPELPESARVVIVGGGIIGTSVAYHLAHAGWRDVVSRIIACVLRCCIF